jgi:hypothetical protein
MNTQPAISTLSHYDIPTPRCSGCSLELARTSVVEPYATKSSSWITVKCAGCGKWSPFRLEAA